MFTILLLSSIALGNEVDSNSSKDAKIIYKKETEIDFEALELEGELVKPQGALLLERRRATFNPLIRLRSDFNEDMKQSVNGI